MSRRALLHEAARALLSSSRRSVRCASRLVPAALRVTTFAPKRARVILCLETPPCQICTPPDPQESLPLTRHANGVACCTHWTAAGRAELSVPWSAASGNNAAAMINRTFPGRSSSRGYAQTVHSVKGEETGDENTTKSVYFLLHFFKKSQKEYHDKSFVLIDFIDTLVRKNGFAEHLMTLWEDKNVS